MVKLRTLRGKGHPLDQCAVTRCMGREDLTVRASGVLFAPEIGPVALCPRHLAAREKEMGTGPKVEIVRGPPEGHVPEPHPTAVEVPDGTQAAMATEAQDAQEILVMVQAFEIVDQPSMDFANECLGDVKIKIKEIEKTRKSATKPMNDALKVVRGWFKPAETHYKACEKIWKDKMAAYARAQDEAQRQALQVVQDAHQGGDVRGVAQAMAVASQASVELPADVSVRERWLGKAVDPSILPAEYWSPDPSKVQAAVDAGAREIPGCKIWRDDVVTRRGA